MYLDVVTRANEEKMIKEGLPRAIELLMTVNPDLIVFGCTSGGALEGLGHDWNIMSSIERKTGVKTITVLSSVITEITRTGAREIGVFTPYIDEVNEDIRGSLEEANLSVSFLFGMGLVNNTEVGEMMPDEICSYALKKFDSSYSVDALFFSCTNWRAFESISRLKTRISVPIVTSNQATIRAAENHLKLLES
jgi:maleate isomerase